MLTRWRLVPLLLAAGLLGQQPAATEQIETWPDGSIKRRYAVDEAGRTHGRLEEFTPDGVRTLSSVFTHGLRDGEHKEWRDDGRKLRSCRYRKDVLHGPYEEFDADGRLIAQGAYRDGNRHGSWLDVRQDGRRRTAEFRDGVLHGAVRIQSGGRTISRQTWRGGELQQLDGLEPFPVPVGALREQLIGILTAAPAALDPADPLAAERHAALQRLRAYRHLSGLPHAELVLVPEWNLRCDAAAETCRRLGRLDHRPERPDGMDAARYALGLDGASHSNLAISGSLARSVDQYMDDSDPSNIDRLGHRRWCLNPAMRRTGFGSDQRYHAMWSMDASGSAPKGLAAVYYPPRGYVPVDLFSARRAFSITLLRGSAPRREDLAIEVRELDGDYLPAGQPLPLDHCDLAGGGFGAGPTIAFRPTGIAVEPGRRYLVEVSTDGGKSVVHRYVVEFCTAVGS